MVTNVAVKLLISIYMASMDTIVTCWTLHWINSNHRVKFKSALLPLTNTRTECRWTDV